MLFSHILLAVGWALYGFLHSLLAAAPVKQWFHRQLHISLVAYRIFYILFAALALIVLVYLEATMISQLLFRHNLFFFLAGVGVSIVGLIIMSICILKYFLTISGLKSLQKQDVENKLEIKGIHRFVRHPLYLGTFTLLWGIFLMTPYASVLVSNVLIIAYTLIAIPYEEKKLVDEFGDDYIRYRSRVPMIVPFFR